MGWCIKLWWDLLLVGLCIRLWWALSLMGWCIRLWQGFISEWWAGASGNGRSLSLMVPQWGAADAEIKVPSGENTELKRSPFQAWSRSVYSHTCYAYYQGVLPCLFLPFQSIHLHCFQNLSIFSCVGLQNKIGHPAGCRFPC